MPAALSERDAEIWRLREVEGLPPRSFARQRKDILV
jgi:hypothetical protein